MQYININPIVMTFNVYKGGVIVPAPLLHLKCVTSKINYLKCEGLKKCTYNSEHNECILSKWSGI